MRISPSAAALLFSTGLAWGPPATVAADPSQAPAAAAAAEEPRPSPEEAAVRAAGAAFVKAYNEGDAKAIAELFAVSAEIHREDEAPVKGRAAILAAFEETFSDAPGSTIEVFDDAVRFLTPELAVEEGRSLVTPAPGDDGSTAEPVRSRYTVHYAKVGGKWLQASVRDVPDSEPTVEERLREIEWLLGEWVDEGEGGVVETVGRMDPSGKYLIREFKSKLSGDTLIEGTERIGWDPLSKQIKSWVFDSEGGYGEALWTKTDDGWVLKARGVLPDGRVASATRVLTYVNQDRIHFRSTDRVAGGATRADHAEVVLVRKPPAPKPRGTAKTSDKPADAPK